jgi:hypothetical protein
VVPRKGLSARLIKVNLFNDLAYPLILALYQPVVSMSSALTKDERLAEIARDVATRLFALDGYDRDLAAHTGRWVERYGCAAVLINGCRTDAFDRAQVQFAQGLTGIRPGSDRRSPCGILRTFEGPKSIRSLLFGMLDARTMMAPFSPVEGVVRVASKPAGRAKSSDRNL